MLTNRSQSMTHGECGGTGPRKPLGQVGYYRYLHISHTLRLVHAPPYVYCSALIQRPFSCGPFARQRVSTMNTS